MYSGNFVISHESKTKVGCYFLGILFLLNTIDNSITVAKSGSIIQFGSSGTVGVEDVNGEGVSKDVKTGDKSDDRGLGNSGTASDTLGSFSTSFLFTFYDDNLKSAKRRNILILRQETLT